MFIVIKIDFDTELFKRDQYNIHDFSSIAVVHRRRNMQAFLILCDKSCTSFNSCNRGCNYKYFLHFLISQLGYM